MGGAEATVRVQPCQHEPWNNRSIYFDKLLIYPHLSNVFNVSQLVYNFLVFEAALSPRAAAFKTCANDSHTKSWNLD